MLRGQEMGGRIKVTRVKSQMFLDGITEDKLVAGVAGPRLGHSLTKLRHRAGPGVQGSGHAMPCIEWKPRFSGK